MTERTERITCPEWALRIYDGFALVSLAVAAVALLPAGGGEAAVSAEAPAREWKDLALAAFLPAVLIVSIWLGRRRGARDGDEYLRRLIGKAAVLGVLGTIMAWSSWTILAQSWVPAPNADQLMGVLLAACALGYGWARLRSAW